MNPQQHYQVTYSAKAGGYQVQHYTNNPRSLYTYGTPYATYEEALTHGSWLAMPECPLLAWGYVINGPQDEAQIKAAVKMQDEYVGCEVAEPVFA